jgi:prepilin-type N-terminal cleavage/methylation domain-containing protein
MRRGRERHQVREGRDRRTPYAAAGARGVRGLRGFTLLELVVIVAVIGILAAAVTPAVVQQMLDTRIASTRQEVRVLHEAMIGPSTGGTQFGFVGDNGRLPNSFLELTRPGGLPSFRTDTVRGIGMGWRGPYVNTGESADDYLTDAFGRPYLGAASGQVRSAGPDGVANTADDIVFPPSPPIVSGNITVTVKTMQSSKVIVDPDGYAVVVFYPDNGAEDWVGDGDDPFTFANVPAGIHAVRVVKTANPKAGSIMVEDTIVVRPGSTTAIELWF